MSLMIILKVCLFQAVAYVSGSFFIETDYTSNFANRRMGEALTKKTPPPQ